MRERALRALRSDFEAMRDGQPASDPYTVTWDLVERAPAKARYRGKRYVLSVMDGRETASRVGGDRAEKRLRVVLEFWLWVERDEEPSKAMNRVLGDVRRRLREDIYLEGEALRIEELGSETAADSQDARQVRGAVFMTVTYRHARSDPRIHVP